MALGYFRLYLCVGGMPLSVVNIIESKKDITLYNNAILDNILTVYR